MGSPESDYDYAAWDREVLGPVSSMTPDQLAEEHRLSRRHALWMAWLEVAKDFGVGLVLGLLASLAAFVGALAQAGV